MDAITPESARRAATPLTLPCLVPARARRAQCIRLSALPGEFRPAGRPAAAGRPDADPPRPSSRRPPHSESESKAPRTTCRPIPLERQAAVAVAAAASGPPSPPGVRSTSRQVMTELSAPRPRLGPGSGRIMASARWATREPGPRDHGIVRRKREDSEEPSSGHAMVCSRRARTESHADLAAISGPPGAGWSPARVTPGHPGRQLLTGFALCEELSPFMNMSFSMQSRSEG
jgi:hypothetical protein